MRNMISKLREKKGFTLAELLIVVAIIAVLVAIAIPIFTTQLEKSREATDMANLRSAYAEVIAANLTDAGGHYVDVVLKQTKANWQSEGEIAGTKIAKDSSTFIGTKTSPDSVRVEITPDGVVTINGDEVVAHTIN